MENPFEEIIERLERIENILQNMEGIKFPLGTNKELFNVNEVADYLNVTKGTIYKFTSNSEIPHIKKGKRLLFKKSEIDLWLEQGRAFTIDDIEKAASDYIIKNPIKRF